MWRKNRRNYFKNNGEINMYLIAGLGNPGKQYFATRHNIGFNAIDYISQKHNIDVSKIKYKGLIGEGNIAGER